MDRAVAAGGRSIAGVEEYVRNLSNAAPLSPYSAVYFVKTNVLNR